VHSSGIAIAVTGRQADLASGSDERTTSPGENSRVAYKQVPLPSSTRVAT
jgi:hypothetical protein